MRTAASIALLLGLRLAFAAIALAVLMASGNQQWRCSCEGADHWHYIGAEGIAESKSHLDTTKHATSGKRTDRAAQISDRVYSFLFPDLKY
ncbi:hypothetical protein MUG10_07160 [Xanthomonas prunicola]|uniref:Secreted protein n=2 Tax=Xanthomonas prunicola TaxID=2053930 RepID=A0A9Q9J1H6_9XANT|nr:hypothetical protein [Xanthomonas prunicola]USJ01925.1 hypothetical protein MUG10_07160 [Xanthomonas prunicola]UXA50419.1 hypothetical protein M0D44_07905 [Xanthomonas prunicola]UXA58727.1 hypothetical protein M0D47_07940 [Xanthomonas prunicola]UXA60870.1 hypothetical protein M0D48_18230 [Xanthomonas prunicola]UXA66936.1 hypothetical protein M0D43_08160 [Xanthomonas prunicola]